MKASDILWGTKGKNKKLGLLSPEQEAIMKAITQALESGEGPFADIFGQFNKEKFEEGVSKPAMKQFQEEVLPMVTEKYIAGNQALGSGAIRGQNKAATDLQSKLAELLYGAEQQHGQNRIAGLQTLLGIKPHENLYQEPTEGLIPGMAKGFASGAGKALGSYVAG